ncbi:MAG TPA: hypothetical protein VHB72_01175 [Candidatus Saccharimonadales bacterium]|nr:hypothetical protein [Candidatus Saccharimonadales bacterium]
MSRGVIAVDIDDVLFPCSFRLVDFYSEKHGVKLDYPAIMGDDGKIRGTLEVLADALDIGEDEIIDHVEAILSHPDFHEIDPHDASEETLKKLSRQYELHAVSARPQVINQQTQEWLAKHYPDIFSSIHILGGRWGRGTTVDKLATYRRLGTTYVIDDLLNHAMKAREVGATPILFGKYPWNNVAVLPDGVVWCTDWQAVGAYFDARG